MGHVDDGGVHIFARANEDAEGARTWLAEAFTTQRGEGSPLALSEAQQQSIRDVLSIDWWQRAVGDEGDDEHTDQVRRLLPSAVRAATGIPLGGVVLALYLRNLITEAWELNWDHRLIRAAVDAACGTARDLDQDPASAAAWDLLEFMNAEFDVETALLTGNLAAVTAVTAAAVARIELVRQAAQALAAHPARARLVSEASSEHAYYRAVHDIATAATGLLERRTADAHADIARIRREIADTEFSAVDASELRGHLASLESIADAVARQWLHVDEGRVRIIYGFGSLPHGSDDPAAEFTALCDRISAGASGGRLGPLAVHKVLRRLTLSDVWQGADSLGRRYRGSTFELEDIVLRIPGRRSGMLTIRAQVQLSELGNHAVLFDVEVEDASAYEVAEVVNLATPVYGDLTEIPEVLHMHPAGREEERLRRLADVVREILDDLRTLLRGIRVERDQGAGRGADAAADPIAARSGSFGVLVTVVRASSHLAGEAPVELTSARDLRELWGVQPLLHPLPSGASGVADWTMYDIDTVASHELLHLNDEMLAANANVTLLASFRSPDYAVREIESFVTFAHSMHGMYESWQSKVREHAEGIAELLTEVERLLDDAKAADAAADAAEQARVTDELGALVRDVERAELKLQSFVQSKQAIMLFVESPAIVSSPALRTDLDTVLRSNRYDQLRGGFERAVRDVLGSRLQPLLEVCHHQIERALEERQSAREKRTQQLEQILGVVLAVIGVSGLVSVLQAGFRIEGDATWWFVAGILAVAIAIGVVMIVLSRRPRGKAKKTPPLGGRA